MATLRLAADENFNGRILRALVRRVANLDVVRVQDTAIAGATDPEVLVWAAAERRPVLTHDAATLIGHAWKRVQDGLPMPGLLVARSDAAIGPIVDDLELVLESSEPAELDRLVIYLPL